VRALLGAGADKDAKCNARKSPLHLAAESGHAECVELLLREGADPFLRSREGNARAPPDSTPREAAAHRELALLLARAELRAQFAPLLVATMRGGLFDARLLDAALWRVVERFARSG
jgi:ankyrin repeat protein